MKLLKMIKNILFYGLLLLFIIIISSFGYSTYKGKQPSIFGIKFYVVLSGSMSPSIDQGDLVIVKEVSFAELKENDVITFKSKASDNLVTHRITNISHKDKKIITKGDANNVKDINPVYEKEIQGKVIKHIEGAGKYTLFIQKNIVVIIGIIVILVVLMNIIIRCFTYKKKSANNN